MQTHSLNPSTNDTCIHYKGNVVENRMVMIWTEQIMNEEKKNKDKSLVKTELKHLSAIEKQV